jgi:hypothetical protein
LACHKNPKEKEIDMGSMLSKRLAVPLVAAALGLFPVAATAGSLKDYSQNGATGDYAAQVAHKNYSLNGATGEFTPATNLGQPSVRIVRVPQNDGFDWAAAAVGAGASLLILLTVGLSGRLIRQRRIGAPSPARPTAV